MNYKKMGPNTKVYYLITSENDGSYIVDGFVSRHELPEMEKWPYSYATIGHVLKSAKVAIPTDNYDGKCFLKFTIRDPSKFHFCPFRFYR